MKHGKLLIQILKYVNSLHPEHPINIKVIQNEKYRYEKEQKSNFVSQKKTHHRWFSNSYIPTLISKFHYSNSFKQWLKKSNDICFSDKQLLEMKEFAMHESVQEIERTFSFRAC